MVVPGSIYNENYVGSHHLIQSGAALVSTAQEVLETVSLEIGDAAPCAKDQSIANHTILQWVDYQPTSVDEIVTRSGYSAAVVMRDLLAAELEGHVAAELGRLYQDFVTHSLRLCKSVK